jgi:hypothetical protein
MASTYSNTGIELIGDGEQSTTWGDTTNTNWELMEELVTGVVSIGLTGTTYTLTQTDGATSNGRHAVIVFTGSPGGTCTVTISPSYMQKVYWIVNDSDETVTITQGSGGNASIAAGAKAPVYCDGGSGSAAVVDLSDTPVTTDTLTATSATVTTGTVTTLTSTTANITTVDFGDWTITEDGSNNLLFAVSGTNKMKLDSSGNLTLVGEVIAAGTI